MNVSIKLAAIILTCLLLAITLMPSCDDDETPAPTQTPASTPTSTAEPAAATEPASAPEPTSGNEETSWKYRAGYANQEEVFSLDLVGEETLDGIDCYVIEARYGEPLSRVASTGNPLDVISGKYWVSKSTLDEVKTEGNIKANKMIDLSSVVTATYDTPGHGAPLAIGKKWEVDRLTHLEPQLLQDFTTTFSVEVIAEESITVPAGTFNCYKLEYVVTAKDGVPEESPATVKTEWWSVDENLPVAIKIEDYATCDQTETRELVPADYTAETSGEPAETVVESDYETTVAFHELMDLISNSDRFFLEGARAVKDETSVIEGYQFLTQVLTVALNCYLWGDSARPEFVPLTSPTLKWGG